MANLMDFDEVETRRILEEQGPSSLYRHMENLGHKYATLANGVFLDNTITGNAAMRHMQAIAERDGVTLDEASIAKIRYEMADAYLKTYAKRVKEKNEYHEIEWQEAQAFHDEVFTRNGLSNEAWTMTTLFRFGTDEEKDELWKNTLDAAGDIDREIALSARVVSRMLGIHADLQKEQQNLVGIYNLGLQNPSRPMFVIPKTPDPEQAERISGDMRAVSEWLNINMSVDNIMDGVEALKHKARKITSPPGHRKVMPQQGDGALSDPALDEEQTDSHLMRYIEPYQTAVQTAVKVPLTKNQLATLVSFSTRIGTEAFQESTLLKTLNTGNYAAIPVEIAKYQKGSQHLINRHATEIALWNNGDTRLNQIKPGQMANEPDQAARSTPNSPSTNPRELRAAMAQAFRENPEEAAKNYPELDKAYQTLSAVQTKTRHRAVAGLHHYLAQRIDQDRPIPDPQQAMRMVANVIKQGQEI